MNTSSTKTQECFSRIIRAMDEKNQIDFDSALYDLWWCLDNKYRSPVVTSLGFTEQNTERGWTIKPRQTISSSDGILKIQTTIPDKFDQYEMVKHSIKGEIVRTYQLG